MRKLVGFSSESFTKNTAWKPRNYSAGEKAPEARKAFDRQIAKTQPKLGRGGGRPTDHNPAMDTPSLDPALRKSETA